MNVGPFDCPAWVSWGPGDFGAVWVVECERCGGVVGSVYTPHMIETKGDALLEIINEHWDCDEDGDA